MNHNLRCASARSLVLRLSLGVSIFLAVVTGLTVALAFPPAPHHVIFGMVRDEMGSPIAVTNARIILETSSGTQIKSTIVPNLSAGVNYRLVIPEDAGLTSDAYMPTALKPTTPFRMKVQIGSVTYLPIEMKGNYSALGQPAKSTRIDLTLGEDSDNDGLPDAWERALISILGGGTLESITPDGDADGDGISNYAEYIAGTYAFDPTDGFSLKIVGMNGSKPQLEFLAIRNHTYTVYVSSDTKTWIPINFTIPTEGTGTVYKTYSATDVRIIRVQAETPPGTRMSFFKVQVQ